MNNELQEWWDQAHRENNRRWLSGYPGPECWDRLQVSHLVIPGADVLEIGVGEAHGAYALNDAGCKVSVLDISPIALKKVSFFAKGYLAANLEKLPVGAFDLAMSHLVAQHMTDVDLKAQIKAVVASLKPNGVFAMQFSSHLDETDCSQDETLAKIGEVCRTPEQMRELASEAKIVKLEKLGAYPDYKLRWHLIHLMRKLGGKK